MPTPELQSEKVVKQSIRSPKAALALETGTEDIPGLPSCSELVTIAAAISNKGEKPHISASRAIELWKACHKALKCETILEKMSRSNSEDQTFLAACGLDFDAWKMDRMTKPFVPLETFLTAVNPNSKLPTLRTKWLKFWKQETENDIPKLENDQIQSPFAFSKHYRFPLHPEADIDSRSILLCGNEFKEFLENIRIATGQKRGGAGQKVRKLNQAARQLLTNGKELKPGQRTMLVELTPIEIKAVAEKCKIQGKEMSPKMVGKLHAAIQALKTPDTGRPRIINKSDPAKKF